MGLGNERVKWEWLCLPSLTITYLEEVEQPAAWEWPSNQGLHYFRKGGESPGKVSAEGRGT